MPIAARRVSMHSIRDILAAKQGSSRQNATNSACNPAAIRTSHEAVPRNTRSAASETSAAAARRVSAHSIRGSLAAKRAIAVKTQRIVRTIEPPSRHTAIAPPSCRAVPVASPRHCRAVPVASLRHRPVAPRGRHLPHRHSVACRRVVTPPPATASSSRRLPPRRRPVALLHHRPAPNMKRGTRRSLAQFAMSAACPSPGPGSTGRSASCG